MSIPNFSISRFLVTSLSILSLTVVIAIGVSRSTNLESATAIPVISEKGKQTAVFAGGCFWGVEAVFEHLNGVSDVISGYSGGKATVVNYEAVSSGQTGYAESVKITYDPSQISYEHLLKVYFLVAHDPTQLNRQDPDSGTQYRSAIFFANDRQQKIAKTYIDRLNQSNTLPKPIVTQLAPLKDFYAAEDYHQNFIAQNPNYPYVVKYDLPKLQQLQQKFPDLYKN